MKKRFLLLCLIFCIKLVVAQPILSPSNFLGYKLGEKFTPHYRVIEYFRYVSSVSENVKLQDYGKTYEGRSLLVAFVSNNQNIKNLNEIRKNNLRLSGMMSGQTTASQPAIIWLSYNVHGNEAVSTETSMQTIFDLVNPDNSRTKPWLENIVVIIDPCVNPDGRERYVNFYSSVSNTIADPTPFSREHMEPWPGGRTNHYYFDLNRDWAWQTQLETQQRMTLYNQWLPQIHVDFHEQGINVPYYFAPAAEPFHEDITKWQREFQTTIGKNNARYFDEKGWLYFTKERFDMLYPSYGDTYPTYNGAIGMTYEQGGSGRAGLSVLTDVGDILTLKDRIDHHAATGLSTIEITSFHAEKVVSEFKKYFFKSKSNPSGPYKAYVVKADNSGRLKNLELLLTRNGIEYGFGTSKSARGLNYLNGKTENFNVAKSDMVISAYQPKSVLVKVLFEPKTFVSDSVTYDITAWALPYAFGLTAYASKEKISFSSALRAEDSMVSSMVQKPVAFLANWGSVADVQFLSELLKQNVRVRYSEVPLEIAGKNFNVGSLIITRTNNDSIGDFERVITELAKSAGVTIVPITSGLIDKGVDLGSDKIKFIKRPTVALVGGEQTSSLAFGEVWHFFEQQIKFPLTVLRAQDIKTINLNDFDVLIYPDGKYEDIFGEKIQNWIQSGGKLIALESAVDQLAGKKGFSLTNKDGTKNEKNKSPYANLKKYENRERESIQNSIPGAIYKVNLDNTHPLGFGFYDYYYTLKMDNRIYNYLDTGWNVGVLKKDNYISGFVGNQTKKALIDGMLFGVEEIGNGSVVYLAEDPLFRGFWEIGKILFSNAVFMVGN
ncbi:M14 metallopeptidase family protein [Pedobacter sp. P351]|uniref:M14 metallopeptidase family protein n=1 Tax=Pedobacter superstes TaxID=3133441 RepID=UPI0030AD1686